MAEIPLRKVREGGFRRDDREFSQPRLAGPVSLQIRAVQKTAVSDAGNPADRYLARAEMARSDSGILVVSKSRAGERAAEERRVRGYVLGRMSKLDLFV